MPIFTWNILLTSVLVLMAFPVLAAALLALEADRRFGAHVFDPGNDGASSGSTCSGSSAIPRSTSSRCRSSGSSRGAAGVQRKPIFGYKGLVFATIAIAGCR
jgi:cytochrome c oxidase subunit 1